MALARIDTRRSRYERRDDVWRRKSAHLKPARECVVEAIRALLQQQQRPTCFTAFLGPGGEPAAERPG